jgi:hypothetical protein
MGRASVASFDVEIVGAQLDGVGAGRLGHQPYIDVGIDAPGERLDAATACERYRRGQPATHEHVGTVGLDLERDRLEPPRGVVQGVGECRHIVDPEPLLFELGYADDHGSCIPRRASRAIREDLVSLCH